MQEKIKFLIDYQVNKPVIEKKFGSFFIAENVGGNFYVDALSNNYTGCNQGYLGGVISVDSLYSTLYDYYS